MTIRNEEALKERAKNLGTLNGIKFLDVSLSPMPSPVRAEIKAHFINEEHIISIVSKFVSHPEETKAIFTVKRANHFPPRRAVGNIKIQNVANDPLRPDVLILTLYPIGDYSTYTLGFDYEKIENLFGHPVIDPIFGEIRFKFRPACFNNCSSEREPFRKANDDPVIDYLAKDYDSFKHAMITVMGEHIPGWRPSSEADLLQVLLEVCCVSADELSDFQDRVMNEAYLATARKRLSLARHARLMDYHIYEGNQADTWLALKVNNVFSLGSGFEVGTGRNITDPSSIVFTTRGKKSLHTLLNNISLYTWPTSSAASAAPGIPSIAAGSTNADLCVSGGTKTDSETIRDLIRDGKVTHLLIQEHKNPLTGTKADIDPTKRQILSLLHGRAGADVHKDPLTGKWYVRVHWDKRDKLKHNYCFVVDCDDGRVEGVSLFHGNLVQAYHGRLKSVSFRKAGTSLPFPPVPGMPLKLHYETDKHGVVRCRLPKGYLAYTNTGPGGEVATKSTLFVEVINGASRDAWDERSSLIQSDSTAENGDHFVVETDEAGRSLIRFGDGVNGMKLPDGASVACRYQVGKGLDGNVGRDTLRAFNDPTGRVHSCWNPFDVTNGRAPESRAEIIRRVPEAYRHRQQRAVTLKDYSERAEELEEISTANAAYKWSGSWRTVRVTVDPLGSTTLSKELTKKVARHLESVRLIGEDLEIRPPRFVPLDITVSLCVDTAFWPEDIRSVLVEEFSDGYTSRGTPGFFHPDLWTFGMKLMKSQISGRIESIKGVGHVLEVIIKRFDEPRPVTPDVAEVRSEEIIMVKNDPDHKELGFISFDLKGGRL